MIQFAAHSLFSMLCLIYYIKFIHLEEKSDKLILIASELAILVTFLCIFMINFTHSDYWLDFITYFIMFSVVGFIILEAAIEICKMFGLIKCIIIRFKAKKELKVTSFRTNK